MVRSLDRIYIPRFHYAPKETAMGRRSGIGHCATLLLLTLSMSVMGQVQTPTHLAALDGADGAPPPCGQDNMCNAAACAQDPDCPPGVGNDNTPAETGDDTALDAVTDCNATQEKDIRAVAWNIADD